MWRAPEAEGDLDELFDETYMSPYSHLLGEERSHAEALGAIALARAAPGAEILDCPCGFGRHALVLARAGYRVTGADRSTVQLAEAERRCGQAEWPRLVRADYRELPFADASFDAALCLGGSLGYLSRGGDVGVLAELRRVLRPGGALVVERTHRDYVARAPRGRTWDELPDGGLILWERDFDPVAGTVHNHQLYISADGERTSRRFVVHVYTAIEWVAILREAGFVEVECFGGWDEAPASHDAQLVIRAR